MSQTSKVPSPPMYQQITNEQLQSLVRVYWDARAQVHKQRNEIDKLSFRLDCERDVLAELVKDMKALEHLLNILDPYWDPEQRVD